MAVSEATHNFKAKLSDGADNIRNFIIASKYLPHLALGFLAGVVIFSNIADRYTVRAFNGELVYVEPSTEESIVFEIDQYTPLIKDDKSIASAEKASLSLASTDGFVDGAGSVSTEITSREEPLPDNSSGTVAYLVKDGDTLTEIGWKFGVKIATLKYTNNIDDANKLKPGTKISVPARGYEVSQALIDKKEKEKKARLALSSRNTVTRDKSAADRAFASSGEILPHKAGSKDNAYPYGYCTYYVATRRQVPGSWGNARRWLDSAKKAGYKTGSAPAAGAIIVTNESWWGHVAYVEAVDGDSVTISEMNARGWGVTSRRTISTNERVVMGYIY
ncbi:MAG: CHAP domain-containing protein [Patescibacteria group bacterium]